MREHIVAALALEAKRRGIDIPLIKEVLFDNFENASSLNSKLDQEKGDIFLQIIKNYSIFQNTIINDKIIELIKCSKRPAYIIGRDISVLYHILREDLKVKIDMFIDMSLREKKIIELLYPFVSIIRDNLEKYRTEKKYDLLISEVIAPRKVRRGIGQKISDKFIRKLKEIVIDDGFIWIKCAKNVLFSDGMHDLRKTLRESFKIKNIYLSQEKTVLFRKETVIVLENSKPENRDIEFIEYDRNGFNEPVNLNIKKVNNTIWIPVLNRKNVISNYADIIVTRTIEKAQITNSNLSNRHLKPSFNALAKKEMDFPYKENIVKPYDILISSSYYGFNLGMALPEDEGMTVSREVYILKSKGDMEPGYLFYLMKKDEFFQQVKKFSGTLIRISKKVFVILELPIDEKDDRKKIARSEIEKEIEYRERLKKHKEEIESYRTFGFNEDHRNKRLSDISRSVKSLINIGRDHLYAVYDSIDDELGEICETKNGDKVLLRSRLNQPFPPECIALKIEGRVLPIVVLRNSTGNTIIIPNSFLVLEPVGISKDELYKFLLSDTFLHQFKEYVAEIRKTHPLIRVTRDKIMGTVVAKVAK